MKFYDDEQNEELLPGQAQTQPKAQAVQTQEPQSAQPPSDPGAEFPDDMRYCRIAAQRDEQKFQDLLAAMRVEYASPGFNQEIIVWDDHSVRGLTTHPFPEKFTPDGLWDYARKIRGPYTYNGQL